MTVPPDLAPADLVRGLLLTMTALVLAPAGFALADRIAPKGPVFFARWGFSHLLQVVFATLCSITLSGLALRHWPQAVLLGLCLSMLSHGVGCAVAAWCARRLHPEGVRALGFSTKNLVPGVLVAVMLYLLCLPALMGVQAVWPPLFQALGGEYRVQPILQELLALGAGERALGFTLAVLVAPLVEETLFRGFLQPLLVQNFREAGGVILTSALFALLHGPAFFLPLFALSLVLGWARLRTGSLWGPIAVHALHNLLTLFLAVNFGPE